MLELIVFAVASALGGYGIGRTVASESIFEGWRNRLVNYLYFPISDGMEIDSEGAVFSITDEGMIEIHSKDGYRTNIWRPFAVVAGKLADLLSCETCLSTQSAFQLFIWSNLFTIISLEVVLLFAVVGLTYIILSKLS